MKPDNVSFLAQVGRGFVAAHDQIEIGDAVEREGLEAVTGGARKIRVALPGRGKRGGARAIYLYVAVKGRIYFIAVYAKNVKENLSEAEKKDLRALARILEGEA